MVSGLTSPIYGSSFHIRALLGAFGREADYPRIRLEFREGSSGVLSIAESLTYDLEGQFCLLD